MMVRSDPASPYDRPLFILTTSRSGSTLLRLILDTHPEIACPPETGVATACGQLARVMGVLDGLFRPGPAGQGSLTVSAAAAIRDMLSARFGGYVAHRGKQRWCDKSLDNVLFADLLAQIWPDAQFVCLSRHCMDVVASCVEACPWGLSGFGLDQYVAQHPGNSVAAAAAYWLSSMRSMLAFAGKYPDRCHRIRYEDLVTDPETTMARLFLFLGIAAAPGIASKCFQEPHDADGPGDEKIWFTGRVHADSLGRGIMVPAAAIPPPMRQPINDVLASLSYRQIDPDWNQPGRPADPRVAPGHDCAPPPPAGVPGPATGGGVDDVAAQIAHRLADRADSKRAEVSARWPHLAGLALGITVEGPGGQVAEFHPVISGPAGTSPAPAAASAPRPARFTGSAGTWASVLGGTANMAAELTGGRLRTVDGPDPARIRPDELHAIAVLLGLPYIPPAARLAGRQGTPIRTEDDHRARSQT